MSIDTVTLNWEEALLEMGRYTIPELLFVPEFHTGTFFSKNTATYS
jgi:hypothetical protein